MDDTRAPGAAADVQAELAALREQLQASERERAVLADTVRSLRLEVQHRVRDTLAIVRSVFARSVAARHSLEDLDNHFRGRLDALVRRQVALAVHPNGGGDLENMLRDELRSFEFDERIEILGPDVDIPSHAIPSLGLAIHELATNAIKFGALSTSDARLRLTVSWTCTDNRLLLSWVESGVAVVGVVPLHKGFGRAFIEDALPHQLGAETDFDLKPGGLACVIGLPLTDTVATAPSNWR